MPSVTPEFTDFETIEAVADIDEFGFATARVSYYARTPERAMKLLASGKECPLVVAGILQSSVFLHGSAATEGADTIWKVNLFWRGAGSSLRLETSAVPSYKPVAATVPIETHYLFEELAGTPLAPQDGALFDGQGSFLRFLPYLNDGTKNPRAGVTNWYNATLKVSDKRGMMIEQLTEDDVFSVGKIEQPDIRNLVELDFPLPGFEGEQKRNYILDSLRITDLGQGFGMVEREWAQSGPFGWDEDIYDYRDTGDAIES